MGNLMGLSRDHRGWRGREVDLEHGGRLWCGVFADVNKRVDLIPERCSVYWLQSHTMVTMCGGI